MAELRDTPKTSENIAANRRASNGLAARFIKYFKFLCAAALILPALVLLATQNAAAQENFPAKLLAEIPESASLLGAPDVRTRASLLKKLVVPVPESCTIQKALPFVLEKADYEYVVDRILELDLSALDFDDENSGIWVDTSYLIGEFKMQRQLETFSKYIVLPNKHIQAELIGLIELLNAKNLDAKLVPLLDSPEEYVRDSALRALVALGSKKAVPPLVAQLENLESINRYYALQNIVKVGGVEAAPQIGRLLADERQDVRYAALDALVKLNAVSQTAALWKHYETETDRRLKGFALVALLSFGDKKAVPIARRIYVESIQNSEGNEVAGFISVLKPKIFLPELLALYSQKERLSETGRQEYWVRNSIYTTLVAYAAREAVPVYRENLFGGSSGFQEYAAQVLLKLNVRETVDDLIAGLNELRRNRSVESYDLRVGKVAYYLAKFGDKKATALLLDVALENKSQYRTQIVAELNRQLDPVLVQKLDSAVLPLTPIESIETFAGKAATASGVEITFEREAASEKTICSTDEWNLENGIPCAYSTGSMSVLKSFDRMLDDRRSQTYTWILDNGRVRVLAVEKAVEWWRKNILKTNKNA